MRILLFLPLTFALPAIKSSSPEPLVPRPGTPVLSESDKYNLEFQPDTPTPTPREPSGIAPPRPVRYIRPARPALARLPVYDTTVSETPAKHAFDEKKEVKKEGADATAKKSPLSTVDGLVDIPVFDPTMEIVEDAEIEETFDPMEDVNYHDRIQMTPPQNHEYDPDCMDET